MKLGRRGNTLRGGSEACPSQPASWCGIRTSGLRHRVCRQHRPSLEHSHAFHAACSSFSRQQNSFLYFFFPKQDLIWKLGIASKAATSQGSAVPSPAPTAGSLPSHEPPEAPPGPRGCENGSPKRNRKEGPQIRVKTALGNEAKDILTQFQVCPFWQVTYSSAEGPGSAGATQPERFTSKGNLVTRPRASSRQAQPPSRSPHACPRSTRGRTSRPPALQLIKSHFRVTGFISLHLGTSQRQTPAQPGTPRGSAPRSRQAGILLTLTALHPLRKTLLSSACFTEEDTKSLPRVTGWSPGRNTRPQGGPDVRLLRLCPWEGKCTGSDAGQRQLKAAFWATARMTGPDKPFKDEPLIRAGAAHSQIYTGANPGFSQVSLSPVTFGHITCFPKQSSILRTPGAITTDNEGPNASSSPDPTSQSRGGQSPGKTHEPQKQHVQTKCHRLETQAEAPGRGGEKGKRNQTGREAESSPDKQVRKQARGSVKDLGVRQYACPVSVRT